MRYRLDRSPDHVALRAPPVPSLCLSLSPSPALFVKPSSRTPQMQPSSTVLRPHRGAGLAEILPPALPISCSSSLQVFTHWPTTLDTACKANPVSSAPSLPCMTKGR